MLMKAECTVYTRQTDGTYIRQAARCHWQDSRGVAFTGEMFTTTTDNEVFVMIPLESMDLPVLSAKSKSQAYIVRGVVEDEVTALNVGAKMQELNGLTIKAIAKNDYSIGVAQNHWAVHAV